MTETTFADFDLAENILKAVTESGYTIPTPIQREAIPHILMGGDVTGIAQTGTGKTAAFVLPMIQRLSTGRARARMPRCLILCPTRELCLQITRDLKSFAKFIPAIRVVAVYGGALVGLVLRDLVESETITADAHSDEARRPSMLRAVDRLSERVGTMLDEYLFAGC